MKLILKTLTVFLVSIGLLAALACNSSNGSSPSRNAPSYSSSPSRNTPSYRSSPSQKAPSYSTSKAASTGGTSIRPSEASRHVGSRKTVCGPIVDTRYATSSNGKPTFLNFDKAYPNHPFVVVIWGSDRGKFPDKPERHYKGSNVCASGLIESYKGKPQIIARSGSQLEIQR